MTASDVLIPGAVAVLWLVVAVIGTIVRQRDRQAGRERPLGLNIIIAVTMVAMIVALLL